VGMEGRLLDGLPPQVQIRGIQHRNFTSNPRLRLMSPFPEPPLPSSAPSPEEEIRALLEGNRRWALAREEEDPETFPALARVHRPPYLLVGCCDARKPLDLVLQASPGHLFIHRNVGNQVRSDDPAIEASLEFAIGVLGVRHLIVCGHTGCGAMQAALATETSPAVARWVEPVRALAKEVEEELKALAGGGTPADRLAELNTLRQVRNLLGMAPVREALLDPDRVLRLHAWVFRIDSGRIEALPLPMERWREEGWWPV
jgi:carbonic anhydrase